jgi:4-aminobutyrate aminotransferase
VRALQEKYPIISDVRGRGLMLGVELRHPATGARAPDEAEAVMYAALSKGLSFKLTMGNILFLTPALTITEMEMDDALQILDECFTELRHA